MCWCWLRFPIAQNTGLGKGLVARNRVGHDRKAEVQRKYQAIVGLANRVRVGNDWNYRNVMFCDDPGGTFQIPFDVLGRHRPTVNDLPIDVPSRSEERRVGQEGVGTCSSRWSPTS